jgi:periplasmic divalent cation tolerance protein
MNNLTDKIIVITNLPDRESATRLAHTLIEHGQAACVNVLAPCVSIYHWEGKTESAEEVPVLIKTTRDRYADVERTILALHPYELPEIVQVPVAGGLPAYLDWISDETSR